MRALQLAALIAWCGVLGSVVAALSAVSNGSFTATWTPATDPVERYEFRWRHFASPDWIALPPAPGASGSMHVTFPALPNTPTTDRWMCVDARMLQPTVGPWLSDTPSGPACNAVDVGVIPLPTPPPAPPLPPQPDIFTNVQQADGRLSLDYQLGACPRGVQQTTSAVKDGARTITLTCRR